MRKMNKINIFQYIAIGICVIFGLFGVYGLITHGNPVGNTLIGVVTETLLLLVAALMILYSPRMAGKFLIVGWFATWILLYIGAPYYQQAKPLFAFAFSIPPLIAGILCLYSGRYSRTSNFDQTDRKGLFLKLGSIIGFVIIVIASFAPYMGVTVVDSHAFGGKKIYLHDPSHDKWPIWEIATGQDLRPCCESRKYLDNMPYTLDIILRIGARGSILGILIILVGLTCIYINRLVKLGIMLPIGVVVLFMSLTFNGFLFIIGPVLGVQFPGEYGYEDTYITPYSYIERMIKTPTTSIVATYFPDVGFLLISVCTIFLLTMMRKLYKYPGINNLIETKIDNYHGSETFFSKIIPGLLNEEYKCYKNVSYKKYIFDYVSQKDKFEWLGFFETFFIFSRKSYINVSSLRELSRDCFEFAKKTKNIPLPIGLFEYIFCVPVIIVDSIDRETINEIRNNVTVPTLAAICMPTIYDLSSDTFYYFEKTNVRGGLAYVYARRKIKNLIKKNLT